MKGRALGEITKRIGLKEFRVKGLGLYLEGQGDLASRLRMGICRVTIWVIGVLNNLLTTFSGVRMRIITVWGLNVCIYIYIYVLGSLYLWKLAA